MIMYLRALLLLSVLISCNSSYAALFDDKGARQERAAQQEQMKVLEARITQLEETNNQAIIGLHNQIEELRHELSKLNGQIEVLANDIELSQNRQKDFYIDLDSRLRRIEQPGAASSSDTVSDTNSSVVEGELPAGNTVVSDDENPDYQEAFGMFKIGRFKGAISKFNSFIKNYPTSKLIPSSHYWIGNSYYAMRDFKRAIDVQKELIKDFPDSAKAPDAMLNIASSQKEINQETAAKKTLKDLIAKYPISDAAEKAKLRLAN
jgi:tol-pal system protein YbgF